MKMGNIFEGAADLTVLPCSAKGTFKSARVWVERFAIPTPTDVQPTLQLGDVTDPVPFGGEKRITKYVAWAASVLNDESSSDAIVECGRKLGKITEAHSDIRIVETPLLGTGYGQLPAAVSAASLALGFREAAQEDATLWIFAHDHERYRKLQKEINARGFWERFFGALEVKIQFAPGMKFDLKNYLRLEK